MPNELQLIATSTMGLESLVAGELRDLGYAPTNSDAGPGKTYFTGTLRDMARANLNLRTAGKVQIELARFPMVRDFDALFDAAGAIEWEYWMPRDASILVEGRSVRSTITSEPALQRTLKKAIVMRLLRAYHVRNLPENGPEYTVEISLLKDMASITLDTTGRGLHRRGYRLMNVAVPLRETLAAALVRLSVWEPSRPLVDPFCASGTIPIEAAMWARHIAPGLNRSFAAQSWPVVDTDLWRDVRDEAQAAIRPNLEVKIVGSDIDAEALEFARYHARRAGVENDIVFEQRDFKNLTDDRPYGCIICNPPYGDRVGEHDEFRALYESMPSVLAKMPTWSHFIYTSWNDFEDLVGQKATRRRKLYNSRIECTYFQFLGPKPPRPTPIDSPETESTTSENATSDGMPKTTGATPSATITSATITPVFTALDDYALYQVEEFGKCLTNRARHLHRYPKRGITCYRLYDRDFPEVPLAVDIFEGKYLHISEYERPDERSPANHRAWLDLMVAKAGEVLGIESGNVFVKRRIRQHGQSQYEKLAQLHREVLVNEGGLVFRCNMTDYLDVGLFLDHRLTREMVRKESKGKRFLNLFCYTGAFTCYAVDGGATSSVSVDLSPPYLDRARDNMQLNGLLGVTPRQSGTNLFVKADSMKFLRAIPAAGQSAEIAARAAKYSDERGYGVAQSDFDLCVCDPPTYSNSKSTERDWDVQRDHVELLRMLASRMTPGGIVYFSNNFRRFRLYERDLDDLFRIREISARTVPEEYRNKRIHRCWRMIVKSDGDELREEHDAARRPN